MTKISTVFASGYVLLAALIGFVTVYRLQKDYSDRMRHLYVASSFFISELPNNRTLIRTLAVVEKSLFNPKLTCEVDGRFAPARVRRLELFIGCKWGTYFIECPSRKPPQSFYLHGENPSKHEIEITRPDNRKTYGFVVCYSRMYFYEKWQAALTSIQMHKFHGADLMVLPVISMVKELFEVLKAYEADGIIRLKPAAMIPKIPDLDYNPNSQVDWFLQILNFDECLYEYRESAEFIAFVDLDDILVPRHSSSLHTEMMQLSRENPSLASFEFNWEWSSAIVPPEPKHFNLDTVLGSMFVQFEAPKCGKPVVIPKRVQEAFMHHPDWLSMRGEVLPGYRHKWFRDNSTIAVHLRHIFNVPSPIHPNRTNMFFSANPSYREIQKDFQRFLSRHPTALEAFLRLPAKISYFDTDKCLKKAQFQKCHSALLCPQEETVNLPGQIAMFLFNTLVFRVHSPGKLVGLHVGLK